MLPGSRALEFTPGDQVAVQLVLLRSGGIEPVLLQAGQESVVVTLATTVGPGDSGSLLLALHVTPDLVVVGPGGIVAGVATAFDRLLVTHGVCPICSFTLMVKCKFYYTTKLLIVNTYIYNLTALDTSQTPRLL